MTTVKTWKSTNHFHCQLRYCFPLSTTSKKESLGIVSKSYLPVVNQRGWSGEWKSPTAPPGTSCEGYLVCKGSQNGGKIQFADVGEKLVLPLPPHWVDPQGPGLQLHPSPNWPYKDHPDDAAPGCAIAEASPLCLMSVI